MFNKIGICLITAAISLIASESFAQSTKPGVIGSTAPEFIGSDEQGNEWKSADRMGKKIVVVCFYPSVAASSAVKQAESYSQAMKSLANHDVELIGVSGDPITQLKTFKAKHKVNYTLIADEEGAIAKSFGVSVRPGIGNRKAIIAARTILIGLDGKVIFNRARINSLSDIDPLLELMIKDFWANRKDGQPVWMPRSPREWMRVLTREQYRITRHKATEKPHTGKYTKIYDAGNYRCICCGQVVFDSTTKFDSKTGWPSFWNPAEKDVIKYSLDKGPMDRVEVQCTRCDAHLGHVFPDGPQPTGHRYCINSGAIILEKANSKTIDPEE